jgi:transcriptional regulator with XRE-family HTH domain
MRPATGKHNLRRLRESLGLQQDEFCCVLRLSKSLLQKLEHAERPITQRIAEHIAACTGISPSWLLRNDQKARPIDAKGNRYGQRQYHVAQARLRGLRTVGCRPDMPPGIAVRTLLLQRYAEARDLFLRPEMYKQFLKFLLDHQLLCARYEMKADYPLAHTARDAIDEQERREQPGNLYPGVIKDAEKGYKAAKRQMSPR